MNNRTKKRQKQIESINGFVVLVFGLVGWYISGTLKGAGIAASVGIGVIAVFVIWQSIRFKKRMEQSGIADIDQMTGRQFESYVGTFFESQGYAVKYTPTTGDYGADLILKKGQDIIVVQAKRYKQSVGVKAVQEIIPAIKMYKATTAWVITNSTYTKQALTLAKTNNVRMIDREELVRMSIEMKERASKEVL